MSPTRTRTATRTLGSMPMKIDDDGVIKCSHNLPAVKRVSNTAKNPGREFYNCPSLSGERLWADDPLLKAHNHIVTATATDNVGTSPTKFHPTDQQQRGIPDRTSSASVSPQKRPRSPSPSVEGPTTPTAQRTRKHQDLSSPQRSEGSPSEMTPRRRVIEAALRSDGDGSSTQSSSSYSQPSDGPSQKRVRLQSYGTEPPTSLSSGSNSAPVNANSAGSQTEPAVEQDDTAEDDFWSSAPQSFGEHLSGSPLSYRDRLPADSDENRAPHTPTPHRLSREAAHTHGVPFTPPQTSQQKAAKEASSSPSSKFHPQESPLQSQSSSQTVYNTGHERIQADPEGPVENGATRTQGHAGSSEYQIPAGSPIAVLQSVTEHIRKLERKNIANQKSIEVKDKQIAKLKEELQRAQTEKRYFEQIVEAYEHRKT